MVAVANRETVSRLITTSLSHVHVCNVRWASSLASVMANSGISWECGICATCFFFDYSFDTIVQPSRILCKITELYCNLMTRWPFVCRWHIRYHPILLFLCFSIHFLWLSMQDNLRPCLMDITTRGQHDRRNISSNDSFCCWWTTIVFTVHLRGDRDVVAQRDMETQPRHPITARIQSEPLDYLSIFLFIRCPIRDRLLSLVLYTCSKWSQYGSNNFRIVMNESYSKFGYTYRITSAPHWISARVK